MTTVCCWNTDGFGPAWHVERAIERPCFVPTFRLWNADECTQRKVDRLESLVPSTKFDAIRFREINLRNGNGLALFTWDIRVPLEEEELKFSPLVWREDDAGLFHDEKIPDAFCDPKIWELQGALLANSPYVLRLLDLAQPLRIVIQDNGEDNKEAPIRRATKYGLQPVGYIRREISLRLANYIESFARTPTVEQVRAGYWYRFRDLYYRLLEKFGNVQTLTYSPKYPHDADIYDDTAASLYFTRDGADGRGRATVDDPDWERAINLWKDNWRDYPPKRRVIFCGFANNFSPQVTPAAFGEHYARIARELRADQLIYWCSSDDKPETPVGTATHGAYAEALIAAAERIGT